VKTRQNPLNKVEAFMQRIVEGPFAFLFPTRLQPAQVARKLERAMEDASLIQGEGWRLAPEIYDIYLSYKDHQQMQPVEATLKKGWEEQLVQFARLHNYTLRMNPVFRLHPSSNLRTGDVRIEATLVDKSSEAGSGIMHTQSLSKEQLAQLQMQLQMSTGQPMPGMPGMTNPPQGQYGYAGNGPAANPSGIQPPFPTGFAPAMPQTWLSIRLAQSGGQKDYRIEKPVVNIGRQLTNDIIVEDKRVSRYHAQIKYQADGQFTIYDLGSTNGITVNGTPNLRMHVLQNGDRFTIGSYEFLFQRR
jgi:FhaA, N-terminal domain/FHA domain